MLLSNRLPACTLLGYKDLDHIGRIRYAFRRLGELSKQNHFSVLVVIVPWLTGELKTYPHEIAHQIVNMEAERAGFNTLDVTADFIRTGMKNLRNTEKTWLIQTGKVMS